jgi:hypothetical protein
LAKTKTSPRGLGAVIPATKGGLTSCTRKEVQARTSSKQNENDPKFHLNAPLIKANKHIEENSAKSKTRPRRPKAVKPPPRRLDRPFQKTYPRVKPQLPIARSPESLHGLQRNFGNTWVTSWATSTSKESLIIKRNRRFRLSRTRTRPTRKTTKSSPIQERFCVSLDRPSWAVRPAWVAAPPRRVFSLGFVAQPSNPVVFW